jgi:N-methylhydantoinase B/oxoprolinase/acetone carboxylase alpha subunit
MFVNRDYSRTERDDFLLNVQPHLTDTTETVPVYKDGKIVGWDIKGRYE